MKSADDILAAGLFHLARRRAVNNAKAGRQTQTPEAYSAWRCDELQAEFAQFVDSHAVAGKDVLDFGCGSGSLAMAVARLGAHRVAGIDLRPPHIEAATRAAAAAGIAIDFRVSERPARIDFADDSFDVILCFDVLEHVIEYESIVGEWGRVLRPQGRVLISWCPYYHPYGHHLHRYAPIPWMHFFFSDAVMNRVCSKIVNLAEFTPPYWDIDETGKRRDRFAGKTTIDDLNGLTIARFERLCGRSGFTFRRRELQPLTPLRTLPFAERLCGMPVLREFLTACAVYEIAVA
jgi:SAM-dependent methyltransferase